MAAKRPVNVLERLRDVLPALSVREARAARHLVATYPTAGLKTVAEFAEDSGVSTATILRLVKRLGFQVYADFQAGLREHIEETLQSPLLRFGARLDEQRSGPSSFFDRFIDAMIGHMKLLRDLVPPSEFEAVTAILTDPKRDIHLLGGRYSSSLAHYFASLLTAVRGRVFPISGQTQAWPQHLLDMGKRSVLVVIDVRRYQQDVVEFANAAARRGATVILLSDTWQSPASKTARHVLRFPVASPSVFDVMTIGTALVEALVGAVASRLDDSAKARIETLEELRAPFAPREAELNRAKPSRAGE